MIPKESKIFLMFLAGSALLWALGAAVLWGPFTENFSAFSKVYFWILLDLGLIVHVFWRLFFASNPGALQRIQLFLAFTFKLVCLGFLVITLKELRNDSPYPAIYGVFFIGAGPLVSSLAARVYRGMKDRQRGTRF